MSNTGDVLEVILRDDNYNPIIKEKVEVSNKKKMSALFQQLKDKGALPPVRWFD